MKKAFTSSLGVSSFAEFQKILSLEFFLKYSIVCLSFTNLCSSINALGTILGSLKSLKRMNLHQVFILQLYLRFIKFCLPFGQYQKLLIHFQT